MWISSLNRRRGGVTSTFHMLKTFGNSLCPNLYNDCNLPLPSLHTNTNRRSVALPSQTEITQITLTTPSSSCPLDKQVFFFFFFANTWCKTARYQRRARSRYKFAQRTHTRFRITLQLIGLLQGHRTFPQRALSLLCSPGDVTVASMLSPTVIPCASHSITVPPQLSLLW